MINCGYVCTCLLIDYELYHIHVEAQGLMRKNSFHVERIALGWDMPGVARDGGIRGWIQVVSEEVERGYRCSMLVWGVNEDLNTGKQNQKGISCWNGSGNSEWKSTRIMWKSETRWPWTKLWSTTMLRVSGHLSIICVATCHEKSGVRPWTPVLWK